MSVLGSYFGSMPPLPALVLTHLPSGPEIYQYPPNMPIVAPSILGWLQRIEDGNEPPAGRKTTAVWQSVYSPSFTILTMINSEWLCKMWQTAPAVRFAPIPYLLRMKGLMTAQKKQEHGPVSLPHCHSQSGIIQRFIVTRQINGWCNL